MAPVSLERFVKQLETLKQEMDTGKLKSSEYDQRLARAIRELREQKLDADRAAVSLALAGALQHGAITPAVKAHIEKRLGLAYTGRLHRHLHQLRFHAPAVDRVPRGSEDLPGALQAGARLFALAEPLPKQAVLEIYLSFGRG